MRYYCLQLLLVCSFFGCQSVNIKDAYYTHVISGIPNVKNKTTCSILIEVNTVLAIKSIRFEGKPKVDIEIELYNLLDGRILDLNDILYKGDYFIQFSFDSKLEEYISNAIILYKRGKQLKEIKVHFKKRTPNLLMKKSDF